MWVIYLAHYVGELIKKDGIHGEFIGCENYPKCKFSKDFEPEHKILLNDKCPECGSHLEIKESYKGEFISCMSFPKCRYSRDLDLGFGYCPKCGKSLELKEGKYGPFLGCSNYPKCRYTEDYEES